MWANYWMTRAAVNANFKAALEQPSEFGWEINLQCEEANKSIADP